MSLSLRGRLMLWFGLVMAIALGIFAVLSYTSLSHELQNNLDVSLNQVVSGIDVIIRGETRKSEQPVQQPEPEERKANTKGKPLKEQLAFLHKDSAARDSALRPSRALDPVSTAIYENIILNPRNFLVQIMDTNGTIVYRSNNLRKDSLTLPKTFLAQALDSLPRYSTIQQNISGKKDQAIRFAIARSRNAIIVAAYPVAEVESTLQGFFSTLTFLAPAVLIVSMIGGWFLTRASLRPVAEITQTAKDITASNLSRRLPVPKSDDEIRRLSDTLNDMISRLEDSFDQIRQFTADASHELRTPLTILTGEMELALRSQKSPEEYQDIISSSLQEVLRLSRVVEYLLLLSRADMGQIPLQKEPINLTEMLTDIADAAEVLGSPKNIHINSRHNDTGLMLEADSAKIYQVFLNLVDNAVKYTPEGGLISISSHRDGNFAEIRVRDTGIGISAEHQLRIFDRFYRVDRARSRELGGAGLGLSIVQWKIEVHGGTIRVESEPGQGSTFIVRLPLLLAPDAVMPEKNEVRKRNKPALSFEISKILKRQQVQEKKSAKS